MAVWHWRNLLGVIGWSGCVVMAVGVVSAWGQEGAELPIPEPTQVEGASVGASPSGVPSESSGPTLTDLPAEQSRPQSVRTDTQSAKPIKVPDVVVQDARLREPATTYVPDEASTATKGGTSVLQTPQSISVITRARLDAQEVNTVAEAMRYTAGVQAETFGYEPRLTWLRIRGFDSTTNGLFKDGLQLRNPGFAIGYNLEPYGAEQMEVMRGPASFLYGQSSPGGLLNYISKRPTLDALHEVQFLAGSFNRYEGRFDLGGRLSEGDSVSYRLTGLFRESGTQIDYVSNDRVFIAPAVTWRITPDTHITVLANYQKDTLGSSQALPGDGTLRFNPNGHLTARRFTGQPGIDRYDRMESSVGYELTHRFSAQWDIVQKFRFNKTAVDDLTVFSSGFDPDRRTVQRGVFGSFGTLAGLAVDTQLHGRFETGPLQHVMVTGVDLQRIGLHSRQTFGAASPIDIFTVNDYGALFTPGATFLNQQTTQWQTGLYVQDQVTLWERLMLTAGGRYDWASNATKDNLGGSTAEQDDRKATGRAALSYVSPVGLVPYISVSTFFLPSVGISGTGRAFTPETGRQYEAGLKYQIPKTRTLLTAAVFDLTRENYVQTDPGSFLPVQRGKARSRGVELEAVASFDSGVDLIASYTLLDNEVRTTTDTQELGKRLPQTPAQFGSLWMKYTVPSGKWRGFGIGGGVRYTGNTYADVANTFKVPGFVLGDAVVDYTWNRYRVALNVTNLLDHESFGCFDRGGTNFCSFGERRTVVGTIAYRW
ncbi:MAG: TonB-dependent siderophore receptor [Nitrospiraceae bacterium]